MNQYRAGRLYGATTLLSNLKLLYRYALPYLAYSNAVGLPLKYSFSMYIQRYDDMK
jgi:hypothetical protein